MTTIYYDAAKTKPRVWSSYDPGGKHHNDNRDPETGYLLPAYQEWTEDGVLRRACWMRNGRGHNADRDRETGEPVPAWIYEDGDKFWSICTMEKTSARPDDPFFLEHLAAWEKEHGVHGFTMVKSASKE